MWHSLQNNPVLFHGSLFKVGLLSYASRYHKYLVSKVEKDLYVLSPRV